MPVPSFKSLFLPFFLVTGTAFLQSVYSASVAALNLSNTTFTHIIIGGGTAGLVVGTRLSEDELNTVLILEAGDDHLGEAVIEVPAEVGAVIGNPNYDWLYRTIPQPHASNTVFKFPRGKILGGSSAINALIWDRASKAEYDAISSLGNPGWDWNSLLPYFKKAETFTAPDAAFAKKWNQTYDSSMLGDSGPIKATFTNFIPDVESATEPAGLGLGLQINKFPMDGRIFGTWRALSSIDPISRTRSYSATAYYLPNKARSNLLVVTQAQVTRLNLVQSNTSVTAAGVTFLYDNTMHVVNASKEVILCAGSIGSPQLLELSGIGNSSLLKGAGVKPIVDLPGVGENMQEHIYVSLSYKLKPGITSLDTILNNSTLFNEQAALYNATPASGALGYTANSMTFLSLPDFMSDYQTQLSELQSTLKDQTLLPGQLTQQKSQLNLLTSNSSIVEVLSEGVHITPEAEQANTSYVSFIVLLQSPFSRGSSHIASGNFSQSPIINPNYFNINFDLQVLSQAVAFVRKNLTKTSAWATFISEEAYPGAAVSTDAELLQWIKTTMQSQSHTTGTSSMQPLEDGGVVDQNLLVHGVTNLRIVDLSVMPQQFSGHPQALVYALSEKAADVIKSAN